MVGGERETKTIPTICGICNGACGVKVTVASGRLEKVRPLKGHPRGTVCPRGVHAKEIVYSPDRLRRPLRRVSAKGEGKFVAVSWDEAMDEIAARMLEIKQKYGPQAMATYSGRGSFEGAFVEFFHDKEFGIPSIGGNFMAAFGSPNNSGAGALCYISHALLASMTTFGMPMSHTSLDVANADVILVWGTNPATDSPPALLPQIEAARRRGAEVIVIDPQRCDIAKRADWWLPVRPGTDGALALGILHVLLTEHLYDREFAEQWTLGFAELVRYVQEFTPVKVAAITGIPEESILTLARKLAPPRRTVINIHSGIEYSNCGVQSNRAVLTLWALTGNLDQPGGLLLWPPGEPYGRAPEIQFPTDPPPIGAREHPLFTEITRSAQFMEMPKAVLKGQPYPVRGLIIHAASILTSYPNSALWREVLAALDLLVVIDRFTTADAAYADYILPATTYYENTSFQRYRGYVQLRRPVIEPVGEARSDFAIFAGLAERLGFGHYYPHDEEEMVTWAFAHRPEILAQLREHPEGIRLGRTEKVYTKYKTGQLRPDGQPGFPTPSGKFEITSTLLAKYGYPPLPEYQEPVEGPLGDPELAREYPLVLTTGARLQSAFRSQHLNIPSLIKKQPVPQVLLSPYDAGKRGITDGERVMVATRRGQAPFYARVTDDMPPGVVEVNSSGGGPLGPPAWQEGNVNLLTDMDNRDPISGFPVFKALLCDVRQAQ